MRRENSHNVRVRVKIVMSDEKKKIKRGLWVFLGLIRKNYIILIIKINKGKITLW